MDESAKAIKLPSGRSATVRKPKVRDLLAAHRVIGFSGEPMAIAMGLVAQVVMIDGKSVLFEDLLDLPAEDGLMLQNAILEEDDSANFARAQEDEHRVFRAPTE